VTGVARREGGPWRAIALGLAAWALLATVAALWLWRRGVPGEAPPTVADVEPPPDRRVLREVAFTDLAGWAEDDQAQAVPALVRTCARFAFLGAAAQVHPVEVGGTVADWQPACAEVSALRGAPAAEVRAFLERRFRVFQALNNDQETGLFTGYYEPLLFGSRSPSPRFSVPLHRLPGDLISLELGDFREDLAGRRLAGRLDGKRLLPYQDRGAIVEGALAQRRLELLWVDDPIGAFFLQIQGSGQVELPDGRRIRVGYAGQNGHEYFAIGRALIERGEIPREEVSLQSIRAWLEAHPEEAEAVMSLNRSYVFFRELEGEGPLGSLGVALEPGRSLAVDRRFLPLGAPLWLDAHAPDATGAGEVVLRRLVVAQDTGGAIRGPVRGDVFWGAGDAAEEVAGRMRHDGRLFLMLPEGLAARIATVTAEPP
jgi:membrane-bound lytic murein transglycosylase A